MEKLSSSALNPSLKGLKPSATLAINELSNQLKSSGKTVYKWGLGQSPFPVPDLVVEELRKHAQEKDYLPVKGLLPLRDAVSGYYRKRFGLTFEPGNILIGPGSKELIFQLQGALNSTLLLPVPSWVSYHPQAEILGRPVLRVPAYSKDRYLVTGPELEKTLSKARLEHPILLLNYPNNPTGTTYLQHELIELAEVCRKFGVLVLSDEIYAEIDHNGTHVSIAAHYPEGTVLSSGLSKWCGAGGWRLGTFSFPDQLSWLAEAISVIASETFTSVSAPIQWAAIKAFEFGPEVQEYLLKSRRILAALGELVYSELKSMKLELPRPEGGFYVLVDFKYYRELLTGKNITTGERLAEVLLSETGFASLPGSSFGLNPSDLVLRMSYVDFDGVMALSDPENPKEFAPRIFDSMAVLKDWLNKI